MLGLKLPWSVILHHVHQALCFRLIMMRFHVMLIKLVAVLEFLRLLEALSFMKKAGNFQRRIFW